MIWFTDKSDENRQFIEITKISNIDGVIDLIFCKFKDMAKVMSVDRVEPEILIELSEKGFDAPLNQLRKEISYISQAAVTHFTVDFDEPNQRYY